MELGEILVPEAEIAHATKEIVAEIIEDYGSSQNLLLLGVMDGALCFLADIARAFPDPVELATTRVSSYDGDTAGSVSLKWIPPAERIAGKDVLIVEGIVDTGATTAVILERLTHLGAASIEICALIDKPAHRTHDVEIEYAGFDIPEVFVVGYGLDYRGMYRNLPDIWEMVGK